jgi:hypothetical protein
MSKLLVIGDIHTHYQKVERIISKYQKTHKFIFMGDYFDQFGDTPELNASTAQWLKNTMVEHPDWVYLYGNHDMIYHPHFSCRCSGFSSEKKIAINEVLSIEDWDKLNYFHFENGYWFSHAGLTKYWFQHPMHESINMENVQRIVDDAILKLKQGDESNAIWAASYARGGNNPVGSLTWHDWRDMELIPNFKQVVGHTPVSKIQTISDNVINSVIVNVDSSGSRVYHSEVLEIDENGNRQILNTSYV